MFIAQSGAATDNGINYAIKIMGLDPITFALLISLIIIGIWWFIKYYYLPDKRRRRNIEKTKESVLLEILPIGGGQVKRVLAPVYKGTAKEVKNKSGATFFITETAKLNESDSDGYYLIPGHGWMDTYPYDVNENERVPVLKYYYHENEPFPLNPLEPDKWNVQMRTNVTSSFARLSREESVAKTLIGQFSGFFEGLMKALPAIQKLPLMFILQIITLAGIAGMIFFVFKNGQSLADITTFLTGGK
jgi:hypothetical protein